ncbi:MAG: hypothetical protein GY696_16625, partial [Gammaproteobacteria bacterium]|nr:hypothetical protein [Gammaproteobacteria bacterium]
MSSKLQLQALDYEVLTLNTFSNQQPITVQTNIVAFDLLPRDGLPITVVGNTIDFMTSPMYHPKLSDEDKKTLSIVPCHLFAEKDFDQERTVVANILLGNEYFWRTIQPGKLPYLESGLFTIPTRWGYIIAGPQNTPGTITNTIQVFTNSHSIEPVIPSDAEIKFDLEEILGLESIGIRDSPYTLDDDVALETFNRTLQYHNGRYYVQWPWKPNLRNEIPNNFGLAYGRFSNLYKWLKEDPELLQSYH